MVSNALLIKGWIPEVPLKVDASLCAGVTPDSHKAALATLRSCQVEVINDPAQWAPVHSHTIQYRPRRFA